MPNGTLVPIRTLIRNSKHDIRAVPHPLVTQLEVVLLPSKDRWLFDSNSWAVDDNASILLPDGWPVARPGRWMKWDVSAGGGGGGDSPLSTKGDLHTFDTADVALPVGADDEVLIADSGEATGLRWGAAPGGSYSPPIPESDVSGLVSDLSDLAAADVSILSSLAGKVPMVRVLTTTAPLKIAGGASADLSADRTLSVDAASTSAPGVVTLATPSADVTAGHVVQASDTRLSDARTPTAHATSHKNGGSDEVATATPGANQIPKADSGGKLAAGWGGSPSTLATLDGSSKVVENPANATATPTASKIPIADGSGKLAAGWGGAASTLATLNSSTKVVEDPANATATPTASKIVIADASGLVDSWVSDAASGTKGKVKLANSLAGTAALPEVAAINETSGPTKLVIGTVADGEYLKRSGSTLISGTPTGSGAAMADVRLWKTYFSTISRLPGTTIKEELNTWPAADYSNLTGGTLTRSKGHIKYVPAVLHSNFGWALGASYNKVLIVVQALRARNYNFGLTVGVTQPSTAHNPDGYLGLMETVNTAFKLYVCTGGTAETQLATSGADFQYGDSTSGPWVGLALYCDGPGNIQELYVMQYGSAPYMVASAANNASANFNSAGFFCGNLSNGAQFATVGLGIYVGS